VHRGRRKGGGFIERRKRKTVCQRGLGKVEVDQKGEGGVGRQKKSSATRLEGGGWKGMLKRTLISVGGNSPHQSNTGEERERERANLTSG